MKKILILSTLIGSILAMVVMYTAWEQNAQYEVHANGIIDFSYLISLGIPWFILGFMVVFLLMKIINYLKRGLK